MTSPEASVAKKKKKKEEKGQIKQAPPSTASESRASGQGRFP